MNKSILIIDDKKANIEMLSGILKQEYTIMVANCGENAVKLLSRKKPDVILLDLIMPGMDGFAVLRYIKSQPALASIPVIFVTSEQNENVEEEGIALGAVDYIKRPYNAKTICYKLRNQLEIKAYRDNLEKLVERRTSQLMASREALVMGMSLMSESHDPVTGGHIERIKKHTQVITNQFVMDYPGLLSLEYAAQIILYAPLHDIGKIEIPDKILYKQGMLTYDEHHIMQKHALIGGELLHKTELLFLDNTEGNDLHVAVEIAVNHHERYDGSGYPRGLMGDSIPLSARIVGLADVYDGLRMKRPYKRSYSHEEAVEIILRGGENIQPSYFDARVLRTFEKVQDQLFFVV